MIHRNTRSRRWLMILSGTIGLILCGTTLAAGGGSVVCSDAGCMVTTCTKTTCTTNWCTTSGCKKVGVSTPAS